jgi:hypothetical protein
LPVVGDGVALAARASNVTSPTKPIRLSSGCEVFRGSKPLTLTQRVALEQKTPTTLLSWSCGNNNRAGAFILCCRASQLLSGCLAFDNALKRAMISMAHRHGGGGAGRSVGVAFCPGSAAELISGRLPFARWRRAYCML